MFYRRRPWIFEWSVKVTLLSSLKTVSLGRDDPIVPITRIEEPDMFILVNGTTRELTTDPKVYLSTLVYSSIFNKITRNW